MPVLVGLVYVALWLHRRLTLAASRLRRDDHIAARIRSRRTRAIRSSGSPSQRSSGWCSTTSCCRSGTGSATRCSQLPADARWAEALHFFLYDTTKILLLLVGIIFVVRVLRSFISLERTRQLLGGKREGVGNVFAATLGVATPFCSCSAVPAFIGFVAAGVPLGVTLSFLIASPLVNEIAVVLLYGLFGYKIAALYVVAGLSLAIVRRLRPRPPPPRALCRAVGARGAAVAPGGAQGELRPTLERADRARASTRCAPSSAAIWPYLLAAVAVGAVIHGWVPTDFFARGRRAGQSRSPCRSPCSSGCLSTRTRPA